MFYDTGCYGRVALGSLPPRVQQKLMALPGEWLEFDAPTGTIVVRHIQPTAGPCLPTIAGELVRMLSEIPAASQDAITGGDLFVHTEESGQLVRLRVEAGGALKVEWAHPDYARSRRQLYQGRGSNVEMAEPRVQRLNGRVQFTARRGAAAARDLQSLADSYEGLYPEGDLVVTSGRRKGEGSGGSAGGGRGPVTVEVRNLNVDAQLLVERLTEIAAPGSLTGEIEVGSFAAAVPEQELKFVFTDGKTWIQRPALWPDAGDRATAASGAA